MCFQYKQPSAHTCPGLPSCRYISSLGGTSKNSTIAAAVANSSEEEEEPTADTDETAEEQQVDAEFERSDEECYSDEEEEEEETFWEPSDETDIPCQGVEVDVDDNGVVFSCIGVCEEDSADDKYLPSGFSVVSEIPFGDYEDCGYQSASAVLSVASPKKS